MNVNKTSTTYPYIQGRLAYNSSPSSQFGKGSYILMFVQYDFLHFVSDYFANSRGHCTFRASITLHLSIIEMKRIQNGFDCKSCNRILRLNITNETRNLKF